MRVRVVGNHEVNVVPHRRPHGCMRYPTLCLPWRGSSAGGGVGVMQDCLKQG
jgi:hypothetical protein